MRKALCLGVNEYHYISGLSGCNNDAIEMGSVLQRHASGAPNFHSRILTTAENDLGRQSMEEAIQNLFSGSCDVALLYFAGHGQFDDNLHEGMLLPAFFKIVVTTCLILKQLLSLGSGEPLRLAHSS